MYRKERAVNRKRVNRRNMAIAVINRLDIINDIMNNIKLIILLGGNNLYGSGSKIAIIIMGKNLRDTAANLFPYMVAYHFL